jgi:hypothetical protein
VVITVADGSNRVPNVGVDGPGSHWQRYETADADEAQAFIRDAFIDVDARFAPAGPGGVGLRSVSTSLADVGIVRVHLPARTWVRTRPERDLNVVYVIGGQYTIAEGKTVDRPRRGDVSLTLPDLAQESDSSELDILTVRLPRTLVEKVAQAEASIDVADLRFDASRPVSTAMARHWAQTLRYEDASLDHGIGAVLRYADASTP